MEHATEADSRNLERPLREFDHGSWKPAATPGSTRTSSGNLEELSGDAECKTLRKCWCRHIHTTSGAALESVWISGNLAIMVVLRVLFTLEPGTAWCDLPSASDVVPPRRQSLVFVISQRRDGDNLFCPRNATHQLLRCHLLVRVAVATHDASSPRFEKARWLGM